MITQQKERRYVKKRTDEGDIDPGGGWQSTRLPTRDTTPRPAMGLADKHSGPGLTGPLVEIAQGLGRRSAASAAATLPLRGRLARRHRGATKAEPSPACSPCSDRRRSSDFSDTAEEHERIIGRHRLAPRAESERVRVRWRTLDPARAQESIGNEISRSVPEKVAQPGSATSRGSAPSAPEPREGDRRRSLAPRFLLQRTAIPSAGGLRALKCRPSAHLG